LAAAETSVRGDGSPQYLAILLRAIDLNLSVFMIFRGSGHPDKAPAKPEQGPKQGRPPKLRDAVLWTAFSVLAYFLIDAALFRSGWYLRFLEPNSTAGQVELRFHSLMSRTAGNRPEVLVVGDSRIAEGFSAPKADAAVGNRLRFENAGISGTTPRSWYYLIRDLDPKGRRYAAVVLPLDDYSDQDAMEDLSGRTEDLNYVIGRLRLTDCVPFARSINDPSLRLQIFTGCVFKGIPLRQDLKDLALHYRSRLTLAKAWRRDGAKWLDGYAGNPENLSGISADWVNRQVNFPPGLSDFQKISTQASVMPPVVPQTDALTHYRKQWFGRILDLYKDSPTRVLFVEIPRAPISRPDKVFPAKFIDSVRSRAGVFVLPPNTFRDLEKPELFADGLHLNRDGQPLFSKRLAIEVSDILGGR
jgi:hypothetical protein